ncbi:hypothetical protein HOM50_04725 [bacterium]|mgnify:CR=1 FL=1|jgi:hypothetical protein|nr:hypothetical protein [bacterium]MBT5015684.1 hypothetical protein [bacterium]
METTYKNVLFILILSMVIIPKVQPRGFSLTSPMDTADAAELYLFSQMLHRYKSCWRELSQPSEPKQQPHEVAINPTITINAQNVLFLPEKEPASEEYQEDRSEFLLRTKKQQIRAQQEASEVVSLFVLSELKSVERSEGLTEWIGNKFKYFVLKAYSAKTIQGLQSFEFRRAAQQSLWLAEITQGTLDNLDADITSYHDSGKISSREAEIIRDMFFRIADCAQEIYTFFEYASQKIKYYGHVRIDKETSKNIELEGNNVALALTQLKKIAGEKGLPRGLAIDLRNYLRTTDDIISPKIQTKTYKEIEKVVHELASAETEAKLEEIYKYRIFGKQNRLRMLRENISYLKVKKIYDEKLRDQLERQFKANVLFKKSMNTIIRDMDSKVDDSTLRITASQQEIDYITKELKVYEQTYDLTKQIFFKTRDLKDIEPVQAGKGFQFKR